jgi:hypothetical protein
MTQDQQAAVDGGTQPPVVVDPRTGQEYLLIKREVYDLVCGIVKPFNRGWDPDDDLILRKGTDAAR